MAMVRWLRAREMHMGKSLEMFKKSHEWRVNEDIDNVLTWKPPESYANMFPFEISGRSKEGCPVVIIPFGKWDARSACEAGEKAQFLRRIDQMFALTYKDMYETSDALPENETPVTQCVIIVDFEGFGLRQLTSYMSVQTLMEAVSRFEGNHPEILKAMYFVNAPRVFSIFFSIIKPLMSARTLGKLEIFTSNANKWKPAIKTHIKEDQLPVAFGGTNPSSCKFLYKGFSFAPNASNRTSNGNGNADEKFITVEVPAGKDFKLEYDITQANTKMEWTFKSDSYDIGFSVLQNEGEIVPYKRCNSHEVNQAGTLNCEKLGTYTLVFDNKYSQYRGKTVHYSIEVNEPDDSK
jgi:hypothetical protein